MKTDQASKVPDINKIIQEIEEKGLHPTIAMVQEILDRQYNAKMSLTTVANRLREIRGTQQRGRTASLTVDLIEAAYKHCLKMEQIPTAINLRSILGKGSYSVLQEYIRLRQQPVVDSFNLYSPERYLVTPYQFNGEQPKITMASLKKESTLHLITGMMHAGKTHTAMLTAIKAATQDNQSTVLFVDAMNAHLIAKIVTLYADSDQTTLQRLHSNLQIKMLDLHNFDQSQIVHFPKYLADLSYECSVIIVDDFEVLEFGHSTGIKDTHLWVKELLKSLKGGTEIYLGHQNTDGLFSDRLGKTINGQIIYCEEGLAVRDY